MYGDAQIAVDKPLAIICIKCPSNKLSNYFSLIDHRLQKKRKKQITSSHWTGLVISRIDRERIKIICDVPR